MIGHAIPIKSAAVSPKRPRILWVGFALLEIASSEKIIAMERENVTRIH
jgi:hypothetical protein